MLQTNNVYLTMQYQQPVTNAFRFSLFNNMYHLPEHWNTLYFTTQYVHAFHTMLWINKD